MTIPVAGAALLGARQTAWSTGSIRITVSKSGGSAGIGGSLGLSAEEASPLIAAYLANRSAIERMLSARLGSREEAQDVAQDLYVRLINAQPSTDIGNPTSYVYRVALNLASDRRRERRRAMLRDIDWTDSQHDRSGGEVVAHEPSAERMHAARQRLEAVRRALDELSPQCRRAFMLHKFEGLSHQEVAERAGITRSTVEKHMNTALKHLLRRIERD
ncbi:MAG: sigma-70 family RNA polymerase sigma factor [Rhizomicrobium sp.]